MSLIKYLIRYLLFGTAVFAALVDIKDENQLRKLKSSSAGLVVLFDLGDVPDSFLEDLVVVDESLKDYDIKIVRCSCNKVKIEGCPSRSTVRVASDDQYQDFDVSVVNGRDTMISQVLSFLLRNKILVVEDCKDWQGIIHSQKGEKDMLFLYVEKLGIKAYRHFLEVAYVYSNQVQFVVSTDSSCPAVNDGPGNEAFSLWYYRCKDASENDEECSREKHKGHIRNVVDIVVFLIRHGYPKISYMDDAGSTPFDQESEISVPLDIVYIFSRKEEIENAATMAKELSTSIQKYVHFVIVDKDQHQELSYKKFGVSPSDSFPTVVIQFKDIDTSARTYVEQWPSDLVFSLENVKTLLSDTLKDPQKAFKQTALLYDLSIVPADQVSNIDNSTIVASCSKDKQCIDFNINLRQAVRTIYKTSPEDFMFLYMDYSQVNDKDSVKLPSLRFFVSENNSIEYDGPFTAAEMLKFMTLYLGMEEILPLPLSGSDVIPISASDTDGSVNTEREVHMDNDYYEEDGDDEDEYDDDEALFQKEEDEISKHMVDARRKSPFFTELKDDNVQGLTDKTFRDVLKNFGVVLVYFYLPWDARSFSIQEVYSEVAGVIARESNSLHSNFKMAKLNCYDWTDICALANVSSYPVIKVYKNGIEEINYKGVVNKQSLLKAVRLYQAPFLTKLSFDSEVVRFVQGNHPMPAAAFSDVSVLGLFNPEDTETLQSFTAVARMYYGEYIFGYGEGQVASVSDLDVPFPSVIVFNHRDPYQPKRVLTQFSVEELKTFVGLSAIPSFGELTPENFPAYSVHGKPFVIVFKDSKDTSNFMNSVADLARTNLISRVFLTWMNLDNPVTKSIRKSYVGDEEIPVVAFVDHKQGEVIRLNDPNEPLGQWVENCLQGRAKVKDTLKPGKWTPLQKGYDFLTLTKSMLYTNIMDSKHSKIPSEGHSGPHGSRYRPHKKSPAETVQVHHDEL